MTEPHVIFKTQHGSKLYGLNHANSDDDWYLVTNSRAKGYQSVNDGIDTLQVGFARFVELASLGTPQTLEAMFSQEAVYDEIADFRASFHATGADVNRRYTREIKRLSFELPMKRRRHAIRLAFNLQDLRRYGRFNPRLSEAQIKLANDYTDPGEQEGSQRYREYLNSLLSYDLD